MKFKVHAIVDVDAASPSAAIMKAREQLLANHVPLQAFEIDPKTQLPRPGVPYTWDPTLEILEGR